MINFQESSLAKDGRINAAEFILAHYLQPKAVEEEIKYHRQRRVDFEDLNSCFVVVESFLRLHSLNTELHVFLVRLLPDCQTKLSYNELKQLMMAFSFDKEYYEHMVRFKEIAQQ